MLGSLSCTCPTPPPDPGRGGLPPRWSDLGLKAQPDTGDNGALVEGWRHVDGWWTHSKGRVVPQRAPGAALAVGSRGGGWEVLEAQGTWQKASFLQKGTPWYAHHRGQQAHDEHKGTEPNTHPLSVWEDCA